MIAWIRDWCVRIVVLILFIILGILEYFFPSKCSYCKQIESLCICDEEGYYSGAYDEPKEDK